MITPELKALLEERATAERREIEAKLAAAHADAKDAVRTAAIIEMIDKAAPFLDAGPIAETAWPPSSMLKIGYCVLATSQHAGREIRAERFVARTLTKARDLYRSGFFADPFAKEPVMRENA